MVDADFDSRPVLAHFPILKGKALVKLDKGFEQGTYCIYAEFDELAADQGFGEAARRARAYLRLLRRQLGQVSGCTLQPVEDPARAGGPGRRRDLESTFLSFPLECDDGAWHDPDIASHFRTAVLRASQAQEQEEARLSARRRRTRQGRFRDQLQTLLKGQAYEHLDAATRQRLTEDVLQLAFPDRDMGLE